MEKYPYLTPSEFIEACATFATQLETSLEGRGKRDQNGGSEDRVMGVEVIDDHTNVMLLSLRKVSPTTFPFFGLRWSVRCLRVP